METTDEEDDLKLVKASAVLLADLEAALPKILWKSDRLHTRVKRQDLDHIIKLIEPLQGEPQLLDARLKYIVPPLVEGYLQHLRLRTVSDTKNHVDIQAALCAVLYTLCKVRGPKVIVGFFNNEPRHFEDVLHALEQTSSSDQQDEYEQTQWQVKYILLLWVSHLLLTPFDLATISAQQASTRAIEGCDFPAQLPSLAARVMNVGLHYLSSPTKAQDAASAMLVRLVCRPDMQKLHVGDVLAGRALDSLQRRGDATVTVYQRLGPLRLLAGVASSADLAHLIPNIYRTCEKLACSASEDVIVSNAVAKKLVVKIYRSTAILSLRTGDGDGPLSSLLQPTSLLEDVVDYLLLSLGDRDTPVRYAAAKAVSIIVLELDPEMGHDVIQAVLDTFRADMPRGDAELNFRAADALKWHGLTLALSHCLFKRTASPEQLPDIVNALVSALQFEQRTATGSSLGTNVRDAANFGIWSLSRRYTTDELLAVDMSALPLISGTFEQGTVIQAVAIQLIQSACLDPAGNIRRGSSAALQELVGRHPNQVHEGIALVQVVDYQAVSLRRRAMIDIAANTAALNPSYWTALVNGLLGWRGLGSTDVGSRDASAASLAMLNVSQRRKETIEVPVRLLARLDNTSSGEAEMQHGLVLALAYIAEQQSREIRAMTDTSVDAGVLGVLKVIDRLPELLGNLAPRTLRSELPVAASRLVAAVCQLHSTGEYSSSKYSAGLGEEAISPSLPFGSIETLTERLLSRQEENIFQTIPSLVINLLALKRRFGSPLGCIGAQTLCTRVTADGAKSTLQGAGRAIAFGALAPRYGQGLAGAKAETAISTLAALVDAMNVDWRVTGMQALQSAVKSGDDGNRIEPHILLRIADAVHRGMNDYTIDERGDIGSLVRLQAIACASTIFSKNPGCGHDCLQTLRYDIVRLSLEKLDRVRIQAALCRQQYLGFDHRISDVASVSCNEYFSSSLSDLRTSGQEAPLYTAILEGCVSCAGKSTESLLQASRLALGDLLSGMDTALLKAHMSTFNAVLTRAVDTHAALELLAFLLDMQIPQTLAETDFKWRTLLSTVQKSHYKSNDLPKVLSAVHVYRGLAEVPSIRVEVLKKLISMLRTNPYPIVRFAVAESLLVTIREQSLLAVDWTKSLKHLKDVVEDLERRLV